MEPKLGAGYMSQLGWVKLQPSVSSSKELSLLSFVVVAWNKLAAVAAFTGTADAVKQTTLGEMSTPTWR